MILLKGQGEDMSHVLNFDSMEWVMSGKHARYKEVRNKAQVAQLIELTKGYIMEGCTKGHAGMVLKGSVRVEFKDSVENFRAGDAFMIEKGARDEHKMIANDEGATILLFNEAH